MDFIISLENAGVKTERETHTICHTDRQSKDIRDTETR